jgi:hypothetical protein
MREIPCLQARRLRYVTHVKIIPMLKMQIPLRCLYYKRLFSFGPQGKQATFEAHAYDLSQIKAKLTGTRVLELRLKKISVKSLYKNVVNSKLKTLSH